MDHDSPEYLAEQLALAERRIQETTSAEREWWKARLAELERRAALLNAGQDVRGGDRKPAALGDVIPDGGEPLA